MKQPRLIMLMAVSSVSILKWWYSTNALNCFKFKIVRCAPSFFGRKKIVDTKSPLSGDVGTMTSLVISLSISDWRIVCSLALKRLGLLELCWGKISPLNSILTPVTYWSMTGSQVRVPTALGNRTVYQQESWFAAQACLPQHHFVPI